MRASFESRLPFVSLTPRRRKIIDHLVEFESAPLIDAYAPAGVTALQLARTLRATALGLKELAASRTTFVESLAIAVRVFTAPLRAKA